MLKTLKKLAQYPRLTQDYPAVRPDCSRFSALPEVGLQGCTLCGACAARCPARAIVLDRAAGAVGINYDECIFCALCADVCPNGAAAMTDRFELAAADRGALRAAPLVPAAEAPPAEPVGDIEERVRARIRKTFGRSLQIREVDAGSCNGCDYEVNALNNPMNDIERLGIHFVASPRHADMLLVTGTATRNMERALIKTWKATPDPKLVVAVGACACSGGLFRGSYAARDGIDRLLPVDVYIPGCPPRPQALLYGILKALDRVK